jgi:hypothetical protein
MNCRVVLQRQRRPLGQGGVENKGIGAGDQHAGGLAAGVALDLTARRVRRVPVVAHGAQCGAVEQGTVIQVQNEHRGVRRSPVQLIQGRQAFLGELEFAPAADHAYPLRRRRAVGLILEHAQGIGQ